MNSYFMTVMRNWRLILIVSMAIWILWAVLGIFKLTDIITTPIFTSLGVWIADLLHERE